jgi:hypothetical protein
MAFSTLPVSAAPHPQAVFLVLLFKHGSNGVYLSGKITGNSDDFSVFDIVQLRREHHHVWNHRGIHYGKHRFNGPDSDTVNLPDT